MAKAAKRGPKKGKRLTLEIQSEIVLNALNSSKTVDEVLAQYKKQGYNLKSEVEEELKNLGTHEIAFMLSNKEILKNVREEAVSAFIKDITHNKTSIAP